MMGIITQVSGANTLAQCLCFGCWFEEAEVLFKHARAMLRVWWRQHNINILNKQDDESSMSERFYFPNVENLKTHPPVRMANTSQADSQKDMEMKICSGLADCILYSTHQQDAATLTPAQCAENIAKFDEATQVAMRMVTLAHEIGSAHHVEVGNSQLDDIAQARVGLHVFSYYSSKTAERVGRQCMATREFLKMTYCDFTGDQVMSNGKSQFDALTSNPGGRLKDA